MTEAVELIAVVGTCAPERHSLAMTLSKQHGRWLIPAGRLRLAVDPLDELQSLVRWATPPECVLAELPENIPVTRAIGALTAPDHPARLREVVCVVDAAHLLPDLLRDDYLPTDRVATLQGDREYFGRAMLTVTQIEFASTVILANWEPLSTPDLSMMMALISHLAPRARLRLQGVLSPQGGEEQLPYSKEQERPGWVGLLNDDFAPHMTDPRVGALRYERERPFHPTRLQTVLDGRIEPGEFGTVLRSAGFCRFATRPHHVGEWDHVGQLISFEPLAAAVPDAADGGELLALGQDLAFFGLDLDRVALEAALDGALLTDEEFAAGPDEWQRLDDPFPAWQTTGAEHD